MNKFALGAGASALVLAVVASAQISGTAKTVNQVPPATVTGPGSTTTGAAGMNALLSTVTNSATPPAPNPLPVPKPSTVPVLKPLPPLDLTDMRLWNWNGKWMASEWNNANGPYPWRYDHISQPSAKDTYFLLDAAGAPELQALNGTSAKTRGLWEADVTLPQLRDGLVVAPLWIYDNASRDEVDFELAGRRGLDVTMHVYVNGVHQQTSVRLFAGTDMSGQRHRYGIKADEAAGYVDMYVDGKLVQHWDRSKMAFFISHAVKPEIEMWAANPSYSGFVNWVGQWQGLAAKEQLVMTVHGFDYTPIG